MSGDGREEIVRRFHRFTQMKKIDATAAREERGANPLVTFRSYQQEAFWDHSSKTRLEHWSRQIGKSHTYAAWAVDRLLRRPGRLVTVLSNSRENGAEFVEKACAVCRKLGQAVEIESNHAELEGEAGISEDVKYENMRYEIRLTVEGETGRIKVLAANPRTARGFSGDLILDEFAFHEDSAAIWEAAEPIISSNPDFLCRILSTGNGRRNMFYQLISEGRIRYRRIRRSDAWATGELKIYSQIDGREITPTEARAQSSDKRAYDQNYECAFEDENAALLSAELIRLAERADWTDRIDRQTWREPTLARLAALPGPLYAGLDVGRSHDLSVLTVLARDPAAPARRAVLALLEMDNVRLPDQQRQLDALCALPNFGRVEVDMTGLGLGLFEYAETRHGSRRVRGVHFGATEPVGRAQTADGRKAPTARVTEIMATDLVELFEDRLLSIPSDTALRDDLRRPEKITSPGGRVSIAASRDGDGHADRFWSLALAVRAATRADAALPPLDFESLDGLHSGGRDGCPSRPYWAAGPSGL